MANLIKKRLRKSYKKVDFASSQLPSNRKEVFVNIFRHNTKTLLKLSGLCALFALPAIIWILYMSLSISNFAKGLEILSLDERVAALTKGYAQANTMYIVLIPLIMLWSLGFAGTFRVIKKLVWGEGILLAIDFFIGIKENFKQFATWFFIIGVSLFIMIFNYNYAQLNFDITTIEKAGVAISIAQFVLVWFFSLFYFTQAIVYKLSFFAILKNSFLFLIKTFFPSAGILAITIGIFAAVWMVPYNSAKIITLVLFLSIGAVYCVIVWTLFAHSIFDKYINKEHYPEIYEKGIWKKS